MDECNHVGPAGCSWGQTCARGGEFVYDGAGIERAIGERCLYCGAWLSLGPSNDAPAEVQRELWLAACLAEVRELFEPKDQAAAFETIVGSFLLLDDIATCTRPNPTRKAGR